MEAVGAPPDSDSSDDSSSSDDEITMIIHRHVLVVVATPDKGVSELHIPCAKKEADKIAKAVQVVDAFPHRINGATPRLVMDKLRAAKRENEPYKWLVFVGHGDGRNPHAAVSPTSEPQPANTPVFIGADSPTVTLMESRSLVRALRLFGASLELMVWNACCTDEFAEALAQAGIPNVVGWTARVPDKLAAKFGRTFMRDVTQKLREVAMQARKQGRLSSIREDFTQLVDGAVATWNEAQEEKKKKSKNKKNKYQGGAIPRLWTASTFTQRAREWWCLCCRLCVNS